MKMKRIISAILASLMLVGTLASCAAGGENVETTNAATDVVTEEETLISANLPDELDYGGDEVTIISRYLEGWTDCEIGVEGLKGEPVNDAVFERNKAVEEQLGIKITSIEDSSSGASTVVERVV